MTKYVYDVDSIMEELDSTGASVARYAQGLGIDEPLAMLRSGTTSFYEADGLGSVTSLSNSSGALTNTYVYDSFGNLTSSTGSVTNPFQYTAREFDSETGLYYYRARYYDSTTGRFLSEDPIRFNGGINFYAYVANDPVDWNDPFGLRALTACEKRKLSPYVPKVDLDNADLHDGKQPWWLPDKRHNIAVTVGNDIYVRAGEYGPTVPEGLALLGHELFHVGQYRTKEMTRLSYLREAAMHGSGEKNKYEKPAYDFERDLLRNLRNSWEGSGCACKTP